jgi:hypothetical protein
MNTNSNSGKDNVSALPAQIVGKFEALGESQKKAFEYLVLFIALSVCYSCYLKSSYHNASCSTSPMVVSINMALLLPILKFLLINGWPCALLASLDGAWRGKDSAQVALATYAATNMFWIHKYGGNYCPYSVAFWLTPYSLSAVAGHGVGAGLRGLRLPGKTPILLAILLAVAVALCWSHVRARKLQPARIMNTTAQPVAVAAPAPATTPLADIGPKADYSATAERAAGTPHFWQLDPRGGFKNGGKDYCGPVAISDSLVYLAHHGFPELLPDGEGDQAQIDLINSLASPHYLGTDPDKGTGSGSVLRGIEKYVVAHGYQCTTMEYKGMYELGRREREFIVADRPDLDWMKKGMLDPHGAVWLAVGWYTQTGEGHWKRTGGHWVPMVGFDAADPCALLIHNPGTRGNGDRPDDPAQDVVHLKEVSAGTLDMDDGPEHDAAGRYILSGPGLPIGPDKVAFLDSAIVVVVSKL